MAGKLYLAACLAMLAYLQVSDAGKSYVRWGRTVCPAGSVALYTGYMTNHHYTQNSGANMLCSHQKPNFVRATAGFQGETGRLYGLEFEISGEHEPLFLTTNLPKGEKLHNQDAVCVRCYVQDATDIFMLPGRNDCNSTRYKLEYNGFIVAASNYGDHPSESEYVCVDEAPEARPGGSGNNDNAVVYPVDYSCGSIPCDVFSPDGMEATCAVCSDAVPHVCRA